MITPQIDGNTQLIGFFGSTYKTSKIYTMYNAAIKAMGLNFLYVPFAVNDLEKAVQGIKNLGVAAIGITIPYKIEIMKYLDELDADAERIGAVNVVINKGGRLTGSNTDGIGALKALSEKTGVKDKEVILLGAGGSARAIAFALSDEGAAITILNRTEQKAEELADAVGDTARYGGYDLLPEAVKTSKIIINTTSVGMSGKPHEEKSVVPEELLRSDMTVMEIITNPKETKLIKDARKKGCEIVYGYRMLLWQGIYKFKMYTNVEPPVEVMEKAME